MAVRHIRLVGILILVVVILVFVLSNWDTVRVGMLGMDILEAPASVVIFVSVGLGMGLGFLIRALRGVRRKP